ncbi:DUF4198 domain-containing protein [Shewanella psychrotolerans]|uniref:DUF4198 domain-containing protein n=1 Tax=Shewanella psychrotolerans TaxID=2864206 RepID=UPI001C656E3B|nr:DUF4198 domain-containing protein [Shewanella psychrotolerans]QYJ99763.1 DUF4198 domain-containing protein [Shewanella psychrotolerans]
MKKLTLACIILVMSISTIYSSEIQAHAIWFAERSSQLALIYGEGAQDLDTVKRQNKIKSVTGYNKSWQEKSVELVESGPMMILSDNSVYAVTGMLDNGLWSKTKDGKWFANGRDEIPDAILSEHTKKHAVHLRGPLVEIPPLKEQQLQILPIGNSFSDQKGTMVSYRIIFNGKAVKGAKVINDIVNDPDQKPMISNDDGVVTLPLRNQGLNVVAAIYDEESTNLAIFDKIEHLATLSFILPHAAE